MSGTVKLARRDAKSRADKLVGKSRQTCRSISAVMRALEKIFPQKTAIKIADLVGGETVNDVRNAERWLSGTELRARELVLLLQSDAGREVLIALMGDARPVWWRRTYKRMALDDLKRTQAEQQKLIEQLEREAAE